MRQLRLPVGLVVGACAFALAATPALAHQFTANIAGKTKGVSEEEQLFKFGAIKITCLRATSAGAVPAGSSSTFGTAAKFTKCSTAGKIGTHPIELATRFLTPLAIEYHANGFVEIGSETEEVEGKAVLAGGEAELRITAGPKFKCTLRWPEQTIPLKAEKKPLEEYSAATYSNEAIPRTVSKKFPDGLQHTILITNEFKKIQYELEGEPCEAWGAEEGSEANNGQYFGSLPEMLVGGNLEFS